MTRSCNTPRGSPYRPYRCLTVRLGELQANVHFVRRGEVYYGVFRGEDETLVGLYRKTIKDWHEAVALAIEQGGTIFSLLSNKEPA